MFLWFIMQCRKVKPWVLYACNFFYYYVQRCAVSKLADWRRVGYLNFISFSITVFYVSKLLSIINVLLNNWSFMRDIISKYMTFLSLLYRKNDWNLFPMQRNKNNFSWKYTRSIVRKNTMFLRMWRNSFNEKRKVCWHHLFFFNLMLKTSITEFSERNLEYLVYVWYDTCISGILHNCNKNVLEFKLDFKKNRNIGPPKFSKMLTKTNVIIS